MNRQMSEKDVKTVCEVLRKDMKIAEVKAANGEQNSEERLVCSQYLCHVVGFAG